MISPDQNGKRSILSVMSRLRRGVAFIYVFGDLSCRTRIALQEGQKIMRGGSKGASGEKKGSERRTCLQGTVLLGAYINYMERG